MWEQIRANRRKSVLLLIFMALLLAGLGYVIAEVYAPGFGITGAAVAMFIWAGLAIMSLIGGSNVLLMVSRGKELSRSDSPQLFNVVEEMAIASGMPMPKIYLITEDAPNAFAAGNKPENSLIAVTSGLLKKLNRDELQGVIAHEMAHIANRDVMYITLAGILVGSLLLISQVFTRTFFYTGGARGRRSSGKEGGGAQGAILIIAIVMAILAPIFARLLYFALSREREYLADASGAQFSRYPEGLASALEKISGDTSPLGVANSVTAPMYIINPLKKVGMAARNRTSTHPPIQTRIRILRNMAGGAALADYNQSWQQVMGKSRNVIPASGLSSEEQVEIRTTTADRSAGKDKRRQQIQDVNDLVEKINKYAFLVCACGLKMKIPAELKEKKLDCPRCGRLNELPVAELAAVGVLASKLSESGETAPEIDLPDKEERLRFVRREKGWTSFECRCGTTISLSPAFDADTFTCRKCNRIIEIDAA